jgi:hypothetical protein
MDIVQGKKKGAIFVNQLKKWIKAYFDLGFGIILIQKGCHFVVSQGALVFFKYFNHRRF